MTLEDLKRIYKVGDRVVLDDMPDDPHPVPVGTLGTVKGFDSQNMLVRWDNGSGLSLIPGVDEFHKVNYHKSIFISKKT